MTKTQIKGYSIMQTLIDSTRTVGELVLENPARAAVFEAHKIDYCCGGKKSLADACARRKVGVETVSEALNRCDASREKGEDLQWTNRRCADLIDHIVTAHHGYLRRELPRLSVLADKVARVHGEHAPDMITLATVVQSLRSELESHIDKEEQILFPFIKGLENGQASPFPTIGIPISCMEHEHDDAGEALEKMSVLTNNYEPPTDACNSWRVLYHGLNELEADLHQHIHKENNILFPRALAMELAMHPARISAGDC
ncbi:MAG: iron-sulfur cluster repair di-iron protein [Candidatus Sumerlaeota bacterium]